MGNKPAPNDPFAEELYLQAEYYAELWYGVVPVEGDTPEALAERMLYQETLEIVYNELRRGFYGDPNENSEGEEAENSDQESIEFTDSDSMDEATTDGSSESADGSSESADENPIAVHYSSMQGPGAA